MGILPTPFQLTIPYPGDGESPYDDNWDALETWANTYPGLRLWGSRGNADASSILPFPAVGQVLVAAGADSVTTDGSGVFAINFPKAFPNSLITFLAQGNNSATSTNVNITPTTMTRSSITAIATAYTTNGALAAFTFTFNWIAVGF